MKKYVLLIAVLALLLAITGGCGGKTGPSPSDEPSASSEPAASPDRTGDTQPSVAPSPDEVPLAEPTAEESAAPASEPSTAPSAKPSPGSAADDGKDYAALGWALLENDGLGLLTLRLGESDLLHLLGEPESKSDAEIWGADGLAHSNWSYASKGLDIGMAQLPDDTEAYIFSISVTAPCTLATSRGISIGSSKDDVIKAYKNEIDPDANEDMDSWITAGTVYGGIGFGIEDGAVAYIFLGASAE